MSKSSYGTDESPSNSVKSSYKRGSGIGRFRFSKNDIFQMMEAEDWQQVREFMTTSQGKKTCRKSDASGLSVLGMALGYHAPLDIIAALLKFDPALTMKYDMFHAVPLHVACLNGADIEIVNYLLDHDNNASVFSADDDKRVALHHAVEYACNAIQQDEDSDSDSAENDGLDVIRALATAGPSMLHKMDIHGDTPIDMTQMVIYEVDDENHPKHIKAHEVYQVLRDANVRFYKKNKKRWENPPGKSDSESLKDRTATTNISRMEELTLGDSVFTDPNSGNFISDTEALRDNKDQGTKRKKKMFGGLFSRKSSKP